MSTPGMAAQDAAHGQIEPLEGSVLLERLDSVLGARRREAARGRCQRADESLVEADGEDEELAEHRSSWMRWSRFFILR